jgi:hypothetical protein
MNQDGSTTDLEQRFARNSLEEINAHGSRLISASSWTITALEIDFRDELDSGGLYVTSPVSSILLSRNADRSYQWSSQTRQLESPACCGEVVSNDWCQTIDLRSRGEYLTSIDASFDSYCYIEYQARSRGAILLLLN